MRNEFVLDSWGLPEKIRQELRKRQDKGRAVNVRMPGRVDLAGGWTDTPPYPFKNRSAVLNTSLSFSSQWLLEVRVQKAEEFLFVENGYEYSSPQNHTVLVNVLRYLELDFEGMIIRVKNSIPHGSGLGGSSLYSAAILSAVSAHFLGAEFVIENPGFIVNGVLMIEQMMGSGGGWQDQIGGLFPGVKLIETQPEQPDQYGLSYLPQEIADRLSDCSLIVDSGITRRAANVLEPIREMYVNQDLKALEMLNGIYGLAKDARTVLGQGAIGQFAELLSKAWDWVVSVETRSTVKDVIDQIESIAGPALAGRKIAGAGGGGFLILVFNDSADRDKYEIILQDELSSSTIYRPIFGRYGMSMVQDGKTYRMPRRETI